MPVLAVSELFCFRCWTSSKISFPSSLATLAKTFSSGCKNNKSELGFVMLTDLPGEAVESIQSVVDRWSGQGTLGCRTIFFDWIWPFGKIYYDSHQMENCLKWVSAIVPQLLSGHVTSGCARKLLLQFSENVYHQNTAFWDDFCFRIRRLWLNTQLSTFGTLLFCSEEEFAKQWLASADFWWHFFQLNLVWI